MPSLLQNVAFDCAVPVKLARFWSEVTGQPVDDYDSFYATVTLPNDTVLYFARVPEPKTVKNRVHLCLRPDVPRDVEVERLIGIGARLVSDRRKPNGQGWVVLADPEGNEFCVLRNAAGR
ncbi:VOC family protein [Sphaerisporangium album]|uniref:VOC family protein n=1 Tax=Sphaerisporangium album TaxID=509200 RepID=A0A367FR21_9ACTN|nr:VOC family protein [Sphaerisporangium album]RCG32140.1 VOC family protein [Sphaerisporangium album]